MSHPDRPVTLAAVIGAHGVTGEVRLKLFTGNLAAYPTLDAAGRTLTLAKVRPGPNGAVARFAEITDRATAEGLRGTALTVARSALPPLGDGEYYHVDLIGLAVIDADGTPLGTVTAVENFGAGDLLEIARPHGGTALVPFRAPIAAWDGDHITADPAFLA